MTSWLFVLLILATAGAGFWARVERSNPLTQDEALTLTTSVQTWDRAQSNSDATLWRLMPTVPHLQDQPQFQRAPGVHWLHLASFWIAHSPQSTERFIFAAKAASAGLAVMTVLAVFWIGRSLGDTRMGHYSALGCLSATFFAYGGIRTTPSTAVVCWVMLSVASAFWAIRPFRPSAYLFRQALGWTVCGLTLGLALLTAGLPALLYVSTPVLLLLLLCPSRLSHFLGLVAALSIATLAVLPWVIRVHTETSGTWDIWFRDLIIPTSPPDLSLTQRSLVWLAASLPWTLLIPAAAAQLLVARDVTRTRFLVIWAWLGAVSCALLFLPIGDQAENFIVLTPILGVLLGLLFSAYHDSFVEGRRPPMWGILGWPLWAIASSLSVLFIVMPLLQKPLSERSPFFDSLVGSDTGHWIHWSGIGIVLLLLCGLALAWMIQERPGRVFVNLALWAFFAAIGLLAAPRVSPVPGLEMQTQAEAGLVTARVQSHFVYQLKDAALPTPSIDPSLFLYLRRPVPAISPSGVDAARKRNLEQDFFMLTPLVGADQPLTPVAIANDGQRVLDLPRSHATLWKFSAPPNAE